MATALPCPTVPSATGMVESASGRQPGAREGCGSTRALVPSNHHPSTHLLISFAREAGDGRRHEVRGGDGRPDRTATLPFSFSRWPSTGRGPPGAPGVAGGAARGPGEKPERCRPLRASGAGTLGGDWARRATPRTISRRGCDGRS